MGDNYKRVKCGIYKILNKLNNKSYIGSAVKISGRWGNHRKRLRENWHHSIYLQRAWNKYGEENFEFIIVEECAKEILLEREQFYIDTVKPEYNMSKIAGNCLGFKHSVESNLKKSLNHANRGKFGKDSLSSIPVYQYNLDGTFIKKWFGAAEIQRGLGFSSANIIKSFKKENQHWTPYGFFWTREFLGDKIEPRKKRDRIKTCKKIGMFDTNGNLLKEFNSQKEAVEFLGIKTNSAINVILRGKPKHKTAYGYVWKYL